MTQRAHARRFNLGSSTLDLERGALERGGERVELRAKTWDLLRCLAHNAGSVVSKDELLERVWPNVIVTEDSLTQAASELRRALGPDAACLRTVPRRGYVLDAVPEARPASREPRVAILPFANAGGDEDDSALIDGLVEEMTDGLARFRSVAVIARYSAFSVRKDEMADLATIAKRLDADFIVTGSVRRVGVRIVLSVSLTEAASGRRLWGERFNAEGAEILGMQETVAGRLFSRIVANLEDSVLTSAAGAPKSLSAFEHLARGIAFLRSYGPLVNEQGRDACLQALADDPSYGLAHAYLALSEVLIGGYGAAPRPLLEAARDRAVTAVTLAPEEARCRRILAVILLFMRDYATAEQEYRHALALNPYDADTLAQMGYLAAVRGRPAEALDWLDRAVALNPLHPPWYHFDRAKALFALGRYEAAIEALNRLPRRDAWHETFLASALAHAGNLEEAKQRLATAGSLSTDWRPLDAARAADWERPEDAERVFAGIRAAMAADG